MMQELNKNFIMITTSSFEEEAGENNGLNNELSYDPFCDIPNVIEEPTVYKLDSVVFAEPINSNIITPETLSSTSSNELSYGNVMVQKEHGKKYKKYLIDIKDRVNPSCPQPNCSKKFPTVTLLKAHIRKVHCSVREYVCEVCGMGFTARYLLKRHTAVHEGRKVRCPVCDKALSERTSLSVHLRSHSGSRPHACAACGKSFARRSTLAVHHKVHK